MYLSPKRAEAYVLNHLRGLVPSEKTCKWSVTVRRAGVKYPDAHSVYVYAWPVSSEADVAPLSAALAAMDGIRNVQPWPDRENLRPGVRIILDRWIGLAGNDPRSASYRGSTS